MGVLFEKGKTTAREVWSALGETRTYSTIRKLLTILEEKGHVTHSKEGQTFLYSACVERDDAAATALGSLVQTFFQGSVEGTVSSLLGEQGSNVSADELDRIAKLIAEAKRNRK